jgi:hypothetical protein
MNGIKVQVAHPVKKFAPVTFWDRGKGTKRWRKLATINPCAISAHLYKMLVIVLLSATHSSVEFRGRPVGFLVG